MEGHNWVTFLVFKQLDFYFAGPYGGGGGGGYGRSYGGQGGSGYY